MSLWDCLPDDILAEILDHLVFFSDLERFGAICKTWYAIFLRVKPCRMERYNNEVPLLFVPPTPRPFEDNEPPKLDDNTGNNVPLLPNTLFHMLENKCSNPMLPVAIPTRLLATLSASCGWFATIVRQNTGFNMILNNPITGNTISLPPIVDLFPLDISRVVLSCNPCIYPDKCVVAYSGRSIIRVVRLGEKQWSNFRLITQKATEAILFHKGKLYVLDSAKDLFTIDWESNSGDTSYFQGHHIAGMYCFPRHFETLYLVESVGGELLMIEKNKDIGDKVVVYKLVISQDDGDEKNTNGHWVRTQWLGNGNEVLFLSSSNALCLKSTSLLPDSVYIFEDRFIGERYFYSTEGVESYSYTRRRIFSLTEKRQPVENILGWILKTHQSEIRNLPQPFWINQTSQ